MLVLTFFMFARGWIGGGDAKLAAATAIWLRFDHLGDYAFSASVLGALLTLAMLGLRKLPLPGFFSARQWGTRLLDPATGIPYGVALASAGLLLYPGTAIRLSAANVLR
jgi:prepilin peptidase CpaA